MTDYTFTTTTLPPHSIKVSEGIISGAGLRLGVVNDVEKELLDLRAAVAQLKEWSTYGKYSAK